ncbi:MAG TPA: ACP S-malonyltransferase [Bacteroidales bacterium]|nr:ACP S-malonyltransferase [Bacteroidales bacterium]HPI68017.1 ACP S-malonyltransferase [Bacteroidales bacterium]HPR72462.1 ACP S-malonyltransferase [Bacteroidales bacterium]
MKAYVFPGQGAQYPGMGKDLYDKYPAARAMFKKADDILGFGITDIMFSGTEEELKQTKVTQPAVFLYSTILASLAVTDSRPDMVAGHSLGEFSALVANETLLFEEGLILVSKRAVAMQKACEENPSAMAAVIGADDNLVEKICSEINELVIPANYNSPGQIVISGTLKGIDMAMESLKAQGIKRIIKLSVGGAFHSPLMEPAGKELDTAISSTTFRKPFCPVYQNATARPSDDPELIKQNLRTQLTSPVLWTQSVINMIRDGATSFTEAGPGSVLQGLIRKINSDVSVGSVPV